MLTSRGIEMTKAPSAPTDASKAAAQLRAYLAGLAPDARRELRKLRASIRAAAPGAVEGFSYRMPLFRLDGRPLVWYAAFKQHIGMYPMGAAIRRAHAAELKKYGVSTGTIRFPLTQPPPPALVKKLVKARAAELRPKDGRARK
jgi:uncharacterized protein YdhG (YjbR/CyaY superfamily)